MLYLGMMAMEQVVADQLCRHLDAPDYVDTFLRGGGGYKCVLKKLLGVVGGSLWTSDLSRLKS